MSVCSLSPYPLATGPEDLNALGRHCVVATVLLVHALATIAWWRTPETSSPTVTAALLQVDWIAPAEPTPSPAPPPVALPLRRLSPAPPIIASTAPAVAAAVPVPAPAEAATPDLRALPQPLAASTAAATASAPAGAPVTFAPTAATPADPATPRLIPASAVKYRVPPVQVYPLASRRLGEQGTVLLKLVVDAQGLPQSITLYRSSGHVRLDEQALQAMRTARFQAHAENGVATAWTAIAPLSYELE